MPPHVGHLYQKTAILQDVQCTLEKTHHMRLEPFACVLDRYQLAHWLSVQAAFAAPLGPGRNAICDKTVSDRLQKALEIAANRISNAKTKDI